MSQDKDENSKISRRDFVRGAGASAAALVGGAAVPTQPVQAQVQPNICNIPTSWDLEADVVVIGSGPTGLLAALRAHDAGASVLIVEANYDAGGILQMFGCTCACTG